VAEKEVMPIAEKWRLPSLRALLAFALCALVALSGATPAQKDKKKKGTPASDAPPAGVVFPDERVIDLMISQMLGAWQIGDTQKLHQYYADDVTVVSGAWEPPVAGWPNFLASYEKLRARMQGIRKDRENTYMRVQGNFGWACFQWDFSATVDGKPMFARGQTTLVLEKRGGNWVIVHDHTSLVQTTQTETGPAHVPPTAPSSPPAQSNPPRS